MDEDPEEVLQRMMRKEEVVWRCELATVKIGLDRGGGF